MTPARRLLAEAPRRISRLGLRLAKWLVLFLLAIAVVFTLYATSALPPLRPWHTEYLKEEFSASRHGTLDFAGYLALEERLFAETRARQADWKLADEEYLFSRFNPESPVSQLAEGAPYNRSFRLAQREPRGFALLMHGLTDSPYSMKALAEAIHARGFEVTVLRLPGHGTLPAMMVKMSARDWTAAVRLAARDIVARATPEQPFYIGGYSTGGTLALQYTLDALDDASLRKPDRVLLVSPAIEVPKVAVLAGIFDLFSIIPVALLQKAHWQEIGVEYDPYKINSFPVNATRQVSRATRALQRQLGAAVESGAIARMPPVVTWQSIVDSTVGTVGVADLLYAHLRGAAHHLVLFDVNRHGGLRAVQRPGAGALIERLSKGSRGYTLHVVANADPSNRLVNVRTFTAEGRESLRDTGLSWPETLVSLGHVALPFRPDDPVYGLNPGSGRNGRPSIGSWLYRGESGAVTVSLGSLTRPRSNPFWPLVEEHVDAIVAADLAPAAAPAEPTTSPP